MNWGNADLLVEMLDRQLSFLLTQQDERRVLLLSRWLTFVSREPQLHGLAAEMITEVSKSLDDLSKEDHRVREQIERIWLQHGDTIRRRLASDMANGKVHAYCHLGEFGKKLANRPLVKIPPQTVFQESRREVDNLVLALKHWCQWGAGAGADGNLEEGDLTSVLKQASELERSRAHWWRLFRTLLESSPGAAIIRLGMLSRSTNPVPPQAFESQAQNQQSRETQAALFEKQNEFAEKVHSFKALELRMLEGDEVSGAAADIQLDATLVTHELQLRLLAGRSRLALVRRYAARCEGFDAMLLRAKIADKPKGVESQLTLDFARYLFEQGFTPLMDPTIGGLRPDIFDTTRGGLLYVEAKQYSKPGARRQIVNAYRQVWSTWGRLENVHRAPEAFLLVFRVGGPRAELPPILRHGGRCLYSVLVDISPEAGSREKHQPISFQESALLPSND
ncbi:MAG: hypothetical protein SFV15_23855 [Polyangiaceae bacterium]|nr:hypothetical protein [Polyangiaceae bacterium]